MWETWGKHESVSLHGKQAAGRPNSAAALKWFHLPRAEDHSCLAKALLNIMLPASFPALRVQYELTEQDTAVLIPLILLSDRRQWLWHCWIETVNSPGCHRRVSGGRGSEQFRNYRPDHRPIIKLSSVNKTGFSFHKKWLKLFCLIKRILMLEPWKLCLNFYSLCFSFHFLFFFSLYVVNIFMRALMLFDPLTGEVPQITHPCCLSPISTVRSPGSHDLLEAVRGMSSSGLCFLQRKGWTWDWVGRKIALQMLLAFPRPLEKAS